ncbi:hypothetical protein EDD27_4524 [Nonomuraea polychroma]|uniref:Uncharacterized protein n=1 Tax=Nonomuraea polychroma TaxID=46176 RepID=A0A438M870_9ACTN|nr:hypothetical protein [Nonomuraea polychroma]RVX41919.1 hypothetical protein EDD27_4524 [Nonomuraea polychroma]
MKLGKVRAAATAGAVLAGVVIASALAANGERAGHDGGRADGVVLAHGSDRLPNHTASDWVTYADHVVVVTAKAERELPAHQEEIEAGQGYLPREVTLEVENTLWSRDGAAKPAPVAEFAWPAAGWTFSEQGRRPLAVEGRPRIEVGHTYVLAIVWVPAFTDGGETVPGQWRGLGESSVLPYDGGVIGDGESEGRIQSAAATMNERASEGPDGPSLEETMTGKGAADLAAVLDAARPGERQDFGPR